VVRLRADREGDAVAREPAAQEVVACMGWFAFVGRGHAFVRGLFTKGARKQAGLLLPPVRFTPSVEGWPGFDPRYDVWVPRGRSRPTHGRTSVTFMC
jgi:hypothetical protein